MKIPSRVLEIVYVCRVFYVMLNALVIWILLEFESPLRTAVYEDDWSEFVPLVVKLVLATSFFFISGRNPGYI